MSLEEIKEIIIDHLAVGKQLEKQGKPEEALAQYHLAIESNDEIAGYAHYALAKALEKQKRPSLARYSYLESINKTEISLYDSYVRLGYLFKTDCLFDEALVFFLKAIELKPDRWPAHGYLRGKRWSLTQSEKIVAHLEQALALNPNSFLIYLTLGNILPLVGKIDEASNFLQIASNKMALKSNPGFILTEETSGIPKGPDFLIIGSPKSGTTSIYQYVAEHPRVLPSLTKEIGFFNSFNYLNGINWYLSYFPQINEEQSFLLGEATPHYLYHPNAPQRIFEHFPDVKLIVVLRNPIERTISHYYHSVVHDGEVRSLEEVVDSEIEMISDLLDPSELMKDKHTVQPKYVVWSLYYYFLKNWTNIFPEKNFLILNSNDFYSRTSEEMTNVFEFLELPKYENSKYYRFTQGNYADKDNNIKNKLSNFFKVHNEKLEDYLGKKMYWD